MLGQRAAGESGEKQGYVLGPEHPKKIAWCRNLKVRNFSMYSSAVQQVVLSSQDFLWGSVGLPFVGTAANCCLFSVFLPFIHEEFSNHV